MKKMLSAAVAVLAMVAVPAYAANAECEKKAEEKKLAGAAKTSFVKKCEKDAGGGASAACEKSAADKKLAGAAKTSHVKKCMEDAAAKKG